ncbi:MAG: hypothetical protein JO051_06545 [Acidobacteriaceae bacterium]|nr:hypothetical protein [Acidobacteriaceae bacterium]
MIRSILICLAGLTAVAHSLDAQSSVTLGVGGETPLGSQDPFRAGSGPAFSADYEFRFGKYFSVDAGEQTWLPSGYTILHSGVVSINSGANLITFTPVSPAEAVFIPVPTHLLSTAVHTTARGILPLRSDRIELYLGVGPGYAWNARRSLYPLSAFVVDFEAGARFALDRQGRFWVGAGNQFFGNFSQNRQQWLETTAGITYRFGRKR